MTLRRLHCALVLAFMSVLADFALAAPGAGPGPSDASDTVPTISKVLEFLAGRKQMAAVNPSQIGQQIPWLSLREEGRTDSSLVLGLLKPAGVVKSALFSFTAAENGKGWVLGSLSFSCAADFAETSAEMRKRLGKPRSARRTAVSWQFRDGWGISLTQGASGEVVLGANPNEDVAD